MSEERCGTCPHWRAPHRLPAGATAAAHADPRGTCRRYPASLLKAEDEVCGEHPALLRRSRERGTR